MKAKDYYFDIGRITFNLRFFPYRIAFGFSFHYWKNVLCPHFSFHFGCFSFSITIMK